MAKIFQDGWCRIEGAVIPNLKETYGTFKSLPTDTFIYYGSPEIQIFNKYSLVNGVAYKVISILELSGLDTIEKIDEGYIKLQNDIAAYDKTIKLDESSNSAQYYHKPFVITESSVILYADSKNAKFDHYAIVYVDKHAAPDIITTSAKYIGNPVPVGDKFSLDDIQLYAIYSDGNMVLIEEGYTVDPSDLIIKNLNSNIITIKYVSPKNVEHVTQVAIEGVKKLTEIEAIYDGPSLSDGQEVSRKYIKVIAKYSNGSSSIVTDYVFPNGNIVNSVNNGMVTIWHRGKTFDLIIPMYEVTSSQLIAYYTGPNVEIGYDVDITKTDIRIYYQSNDLSNTYYEKISSDLCTFIPTTIEHEGVNQITVQYNGKKGLVTTKMIVIGITPEVHMNFIEADYTGPEIVQGSFFSPEKVIVKAHYSDGSVVTIKNGFLLNSNVVEHVGINEFIVTYRDKNTKDECQTTLTVIGLEKDTTTKDNSNLIAINNNYPEASRINNRFRGPAESFKHDNMNFDIFKNIEKLYEIYYGIQEDYKKLVDQVNGINCIKINLLNDIQKLENNAKDIFMSDKYRG